MPFMNRIRVNNVKYNFGTQFYDDFMMRFSSKNTIYDLANGGGKSVLMLLLMQNMIPNCTLDDKQPVEKLFRQGNDNTTIHSLIEWKLDPCYMRNGYRYMVTGFCARKGRDNGQEEETAQNASVEYYNYCIFYRDYGEHDIKNLPLVRDGERVTYNGLKAYLRDLPKRDLGVEVYIFDRKGDYQSFITGYGLYESQWEIIRGINRTEGHVRTYFESNYKTTRKIMEDLLIEGVIEKSYNNRIGNDGDDGMARTLLDIKDRLLELSRRKNEISNFDRQMELLTDFAGKLGEFKELCGRKKECEESLLAFLVATKRLLQDKEADLAGLKEELTKNEAARGEENRQIVLTEIAGQEKECGELDALLNATQEELTAAEKEWLVLEARLSGQETASDYENYKRYTGLVLETKELMNQEGLGDEEILMQLQRLTAAKEQILLPRLEKLRERLAQTEADKEKLSNTIEKLTAECEECFGRIHEEEGCKAELEKEERLLDENLNAAMTRCNLAVSSGILPLCDELLTEKDNNATAIAGLKKDLAAAQERLTGLRERLAGINTGRESLETEGNAIDAKLLALAQTEDKISRLKDIYREASLPSLEKSVRHMVEELQQTCWENEKRTRETMGLLTDYEAGRLPEVFAARDQVAACLADRYDGILTGSEYLARLTPEEAALAMESCPILPYAVLTENAATVLQEPALKKMNLHFGIVPILSLQAVRKGTETENDLLYQDLRFIYDEGKGRSECLRLREELSQLEETRKKNEDRKAVLDEDLSLICDYLRGETVEELKARKADLVGRLTQLEEEGNRLKTEREGLLLKTENLEKALSEEEERRERISKSYEEAVKAADLLKEREELTTRKLATQSEREELGRNYHQRMNALRDAKDGDRRLTAEIEALKKETAEKEAYFATNYAMYRKEGSLPVTDLTEEEIDAKAGALRKQLLAESGSRNDKERLLATYEEELHKAAEQLRYHGMTPKEAEAAYAEGRLLPASVEDRLATRKLLENAKHKTGRLRDTLDAQSGQKNRIEGGLAHAIAQYESRFGKYDAEESAGLTDTASHKRELERLTGRQKEIEGSIKKLEEDNKEFFFMERDLERIIRNADLSLPEILPQKEQSEDINPRDYEKVQKNYETLLKEVSRRKNTFLQEKNTLIEEIHKLSAYELAEELRKSIYAPETAADADNEAAGLRETVECIRLERDNIEQGIEDMNRIKDSFEERCIQICSNIRTELDRLPKLSRITLDAEPISMITLSIPYIKEELVKDKMSAYIDETVTGAELLATVEEKLKYIRSKLSWKKLFSVVVTDMNGIKLCLYKREHIKDQSRYLRYEEAVGSTGQSQGIYIQFLIALIHYISSINAVGKENGIIGKTIFIDNPFGAAKDVYIWEPIFKLLKTNHVQLVVPARGATPAITAMFDVNYVLGQKMTGRRLQTVVVDYHSQVTTEELESGILEYEQTTLPLD